MYWLKYKNAMRLLEQYKLEEAQKCLVELMEKYKSKPETYVAMSKLMFIKNSLEETKRYLEHLISLRNWYNKEVVRNILGITNWKLLFSYKFFCRGD